MQNLRDLDLKDLQALCRKFNQPSYRMSQLADWIYKKNAQSYSEMKNLPRSFLEGLAKRLSVVSLTMKKELTSKDGSRKFLFQTRDGNFLESVFIPHENRRTVCLSTQIGCRMKCGFCATGKERFVRNLTAAEILDQLSLIQKSIGQSITNVVFMGMGEPLDNVEALFKAVRILNAPWGYNLGLRRITISTIGYLPGLKRFLRGGCPPVRLAFSLHSSRQALREKLIPAARRYPLQEVLSLLKKIRRKLKREITLEYVLIKSLNDGDSEVKGIAQIARSLGAKVNIIPFNAAAGFKWRSPSPAEAEKFKKRLEAAGTQVTLRRSVGSDIQAACGQLRLIERDA